MKLLRRPVPPILAYALSVAFDRAFSIITVPLMALFMTPDFYGGYEVVLSLTAILSALMVFGVNDTAMRFLATVESGKSRRQRASETLGASLCLAAVFGGMIQLLASAMVEAWGIQFDMSALRLTFISLSMASLIDLGFVWLRLHDRAQLYFWISTLRTLAHVGATWLALFLGLKAVGVVQFNAVVGIATAAGLGLLTFKETGVSLSSRAIRELAVYGTPIVLGSLAIVAIGPLNRLFLLGVASDSDIGVFGLASRLALAAGLAAQPFIMWWFPKRLAVLMAPTGREENVRMWGYGVALTMFNALGVLLLAPLFIQGVLPPSYQAAIAYLPGCVLIVLLGQIVQMTSVGAMSKGNGFSMLSIDLSGAAVAIGCLYTLVPMFGVSGAIASGIVSQIVRLTLHLIVKVDDARLYYPLGSTALAGLAGYAIFIAAPESSISRLAWTCAGLLSVATLFHFLRIAQLSPRAMSVFLRNDASDGGTR